MLPDENKPFADAHREQLENVRQTLIKLRASDSPDIPIDVAEIDRCMDAMRSASRGFDRYEACFADEVRQKFLYRDRWLELREKTKQ